MPEQAEGGSSLIEGLKHKMLVHLFHKKKQEAVGGKQEALKQFHYVFENYVNLLMWKVGPANLLMWKVGCVNFSMRKVGCVNLLMWKVGYVNPLP